MRNILAFTLLAAVLRGLAFSEQQQQPATQQVKQLCDELNGDLHSYASKKSDQYNKTLIGKYIKLGGLLEQAQTELGSKIKDSSDSLVKDVLQEKLDGFKKLRDAIPDAIYSLASTNGPPATACNLNSGGTLTEAEKKPSEDDKNSSGTETPAESSGSARAVVNTPFTRAVAGFDVSGASSADPQAKFFGEFFINAPLGSPYGVKAAFHSVVSDSVDCAKLRDKDPLESKWWVWLNPRISTIAQPTALTSFTTAMAFLKPAIDAKPEKIVQSLEFLGGLEYVLMKPRSSFGFGGGDGTTARLGLSAIAGAGAITPLSQSQAPPTIFDVTPQLRTLFSVPTTQTHIAFVPKERDRFFRQYYVGLRLRTYFFRPQLKALKVQQTDSDGKPIYGANGKPLKLYEPDYGKPEVLESRFPGIFDVAFGQNEYVTGGRLGGGVLKIEGFYPFPFAPAFHVFASVDLALKRRATLSNPVLLTPTSMPPGITDASVFVQPVDQPNRDRYRIGIGIDILSLMKSLNKPNEELKKQNQDLQSQLDDLKKNLEELKKH